MSLYILFINLIFSCILAIGNTVKIMITELQFTILRSNIIE